MNKVIQIGRLTRDAEARWNGDKCVTRLTLAVDRRYKIEGGDSADFISCVAFGKTAEFLEKYGRKGTKFAIEGRIQTGSYTNKDGQKVYTTDVVIEQCEFAESKRDTQPAPQPADIGDGFMSFPDGIEEELPF